MKVTKTKRMPLTGGTTDPCRSPKLSESASFSVLPVGGVVFKPLILQLNQAQLLPDNPLYSAT